MLPTVEEMLARWQSVSAAAFEAERVECRKPAVNVVAIDGPRKSAEYRIAPFHTTWGHGFALSKLGGGEVYSVLVGVRGEPDRCDCGAATFHPHKPCKHVLACRKLVAEGMPVPAPRKPANTARDLANDRAYRM